MTRPWTADFDFYPAAIDGRRASIVVDLAAPDHAPVAGCGALVTVRVAMLHPREDGLRDAVELEPLRELEDVVVPALEEGVSAIPVGRLMVNGVLVFYAYAPDDTTDVAVTVALAGVDPGPYTLRTAVAPDPEWQLLRELLAPDPYARQAIWNRRLLVQFAAQGDDPSAIREIDHVVLFPTAEAAQTAAEALSAAGYRVDPPVAEDDSVRLEFHRDESLADGAADTFVEQVLDLVLPLGGDYDGWGASVMTQAVGEA